MTDPSQAAANASQDESLDSETLIQLLKEKAKELKTAQKKLKKVEDKFVEMHKSQKNLINDRETFIQFLHLVFPQNLLEDEIMLMPEGSEGYGMFDHNHIRQFWTLTQQNKENEHLAIMQAMQDEKKLLCDRLKEAESTQKQQAHKGAWEIVDEGAEAQPLAKKCAQQQEHIQELQAKIKELAEDSKSINRQRGEQQDLAQKLEDDYVKQLEDLQATIDEVQAENSEMKARQLMNAFQSQGLQGSAGAFSAITDLTNKTANAGNVEEVNDLKMKLSKKTNEILQLQDDKNELQQKLDDQSAQIDNLKKQIAQKPAEKEAASAAPETDDANSSVNISMNASRIHNMAANNISTLSSSLLNDIDHQEQFLQQIEQHKLLAQEKDAELEKKKKHNAELEQKLQKLLGEFAQTRTKAQQMLVEKNNQIQKLRQKYGKKNKSRGRSANPASMRSSSQVTGNDEDDQLQEDEGFKLGGPGDHYDSSDSDSDSLSGRKNRKSRYDRHNDSSQFASIDSTSRSYVKNVLLKYFEYQAGGLEKEMLMMEKVLFTVLQIQSSELESLKDLRVKSYNQGVMSYIWAADAEKLVAQPVETKTAIHK